MPRVANWVWYSIGNNAMARSSFGDRRSPKTKPHDMSNGLSQYKRESGLFGLGNAWHCTRSQPHNSDWPPFFRIEIDSVLVGNQGTTPHNNWVIIREACLALVTLGPDRGPSLTTPIGAGLAEEGARVVVALQASPGQLWMLLLLKINASSPPQFTHDGATSRRESNFFPTWYSFRDFFHTRCSFGGNQTSFTLGTLLGNRADDGLSDET